MPHILTTCWRLFNPPPPFVSENRRATGQKIQQSPEKTLKKCILTIVPLFLFAMLATPAALYAEFVWLDHNGNTRHTKHPPQPHQVQKYLSSTQQKQQKKAKVDLYVTSWCPYCHKAKAFFKSRNIAVTVYDIEKDRGAAARKRKLDPRRGVPFAVVNGTGIHGYAPERYLQALKAK